MDFYLATLFQALRNPNKEEINPVMAERVGTNAVVSVCFVVCVYECSYDAWRVRINLILCQAVQLHSICVLENHISIACRAKGQHTKSRTLHGRHLELQQAHIVVGGTHVGKKIADDAECRKVVLKFLAGSTIQNVGTAVRLSV